MVDIDLLQQIVMIVPGEWYKVTMILKTINVASTLTLKDSEVDIWNVAVLYSWKNCIHTLSDHYEVTQTETKQLFVKNAKGS